MSSTFDSITAMARNDCPLDYWVLDTCRGLLPDHGVFCGMGVNVGNLSREKAQPKPGKVSIVSFELQQELGDRLVASCQLRWFVNVFVVDADVGRTNGLISLAEEEHEHGGHGHVACEAVATDGGRVSSTGLASRDLRLEIS